MKSAKILSMMKNTLMDAARKSIRVPLPRQTGGYHKTAKGVLDRKTKHKNRKDWE